ncbi:DNA-directed RNA polymerases II IV and V subunit 12 [Bienertia sinuspersici]
MDPQPEHVSYICGDCGQENTLKPGDVIQCRECGYRILYKKRTRRRYRVYDDAFELCSRLENNEITRILSNMKLAEGVASLSQDQRCNVSLNKSGSD